MTSNSLRNIAIVSALLLGAAFALIFFYAPLDADQGFIQKIFYLHVPLAIIALGGFIVGGIHAIRHLRSGDPVHDARSYVAIHMSVIFGVAVLITGAIWARASWGVWWEWREPTLVSFLIVFLLYATYYPLRYAIPERDRQARYASVFAITAGAFVPLNFIAVRLAESFIHPRTFATANGGLPPKMQLRLLGLHARDRAALVHAGPLRADREAHPRPAQPPAPQPSIRRHAAARRRRPDRTPGTTRSACRRCPWMKPASTSPPPTRSSPCCLSSTSAIMAARLANLSREIESLHRARRTSEPGRARVRRRREPADGAESEETPA